MQGNGNASTTGLCPDCYFGTTIICPHALVINGSVVDTSEVGLTPLLPLFSTSLSLFSTPLLLLSIPLSLSYYVSPSHSLLPPPLSLTLTNSNFNPKLTLAFM